MSLRQRPAWATDALSAGVLLVLCVAVYAQVLGHGFVMFDDPDYLVDNPVVRRGLSLEGLRWAFTSVGQFHWHPLTWISHLLDVELYGLAPRGHHLTSLGLHLVNTWLVYALLRRTTGDAAASLLAAALFAIHPTRAEAVAWVSARKDLLAGLFGLLSLHAYIRYTARLRWRWLVVSAALLGAGLLAKSSLLVWPLAALALDVWPLRRLGDATRVVAGPRDPPVVGWRRALLEKALLVAPVALALPVVVFANLGGSAEHLERYLPAPGTVAMALDTAVFYAQITLWPTGLYTPRPVIGAIPWWRAALSLILVGGALVVAVRARRRWPWVLAGLTWYLAVLLPVSGFFWAGPASRADRYTYLPSLGLLIAVAWSARALLRRWPAMRQLVVGGAAALVLLLAVLGWRQVATWRDDATMLGHAHAIDPANGFVLNNMGVLQQRLGHTDEALAYFRRAHQANSSLSIALLNQARLLTRLGRADEASQAWRRYVRGHRHELDVAAEAGQALVGLERPMVAVEVLTPVVDQAPGASAPRLALALALLQAGQVEAAAPHLREVLARTPTHVEASYRLGAIRAYQGQLDEAIALYRQALAGAADRVDIWTDLGSALARRGRPAEARAAYARALQLEPGFAPAREGLADLAPGGVPGDAPAPRR